MAIWPILMNWKVISSTLFPMAQCFGSQIDFQDLARGFLATWTGFFLAALILIGTIVHVLYSTWKTCRLLVLNNWSTKCTISEDSAQYERLTSWLAKHPAALSLTEFKALDDGDDEADVAAGIDFADGEQTLDIRQLKVKTVSQFLS